MGTWSCHSCGKAWEADGQPGFKGTCPNCDAYLHCCLNCELFDEYAHNKCKSPTTDWVGDREKFNHCEEFQMRKQEADARKGARSKGARPQWDAIWKKGKP